MPPPRVTIDELPEQTVVEDTNLIVVQDTGVTKKMSIATLKTTQTTPLLDHLNDAVDAHDATAISATPAGEGVDGANVQVQLGQLAALVNDLAGDIAADDDVWVGSDAPSDAATELWWDTDEPDPISIGDGDYVRTRAPGDPRLSETVATVNLENYDLRRAGPVGTTDDTATWTAAVAAVAAAGGGKIYWAGDSIATQIALPSNVGLSGLGRGRSRLVHKVGRAAGQHLLVLASTNVLAVVLEHFTIHGQRTSQTGDANLVHFTNLAGTVTHHAKHIIRDLYLEAVLGEALYLGAYMRESSVDNVVIYNASTYGLHLAAFGDSSLSHMDVGSCGSDCYYMENPSTCRFSSLKAWFAGQTVAGSRGFYLRNGNGNNFSDLTAQENSGAGFFAFGQAGDLLGLSINGLVCDSNNTAGASHPGLSFNRVVGATVAGLVSMKNANGLGTNFAVASLDGGTANCRLVATYDPASVSWAILGTDIGANMVDLGQGSIAATYGTNYTPTPYRHNEVRMTLTGPITFNAPSVHSSQFPIGFRLRLVLTQDATGGRAVTLNAAYKTPAGFSLTTTPNTTSILDFVCHGAAWRLTNWLTAIAA